MGVSTGCFSQSSLVLIVLGCLFIKMDIHVWEIILLDIIDKVHQKLVWLLIRMDLWETILLDSIDKVHENLGWLLIKMDLLDMSINDLESLEVSDLDCFIVYGQTDEYSCLVYSLNPADPLHADIYAWDMMTSSNGNIFRVAGPLCGDRWIPRTKASDAELWCFLRSAPEQRV